ncbi:hypothetical protein D9M71_621180 [compost metagenome]
MPMKPRVFTPRADMSSTRALAIRSSFWVVLNTHFFCSFIGSTTAAVPTGASSGTPASATNWITPMALGEPLGPMMASTFSSLISFFSALTVAVGSLPSSSGM